MLRTIELAAPFRRRRPWTLLADVNTANVSAGVTAGLFYAFGAIPVYFGATAILGLSPEEASSWFFITFFTSAVSSLVITLRFRQPLPIGWTIPGLVFLSSTGDRYTHAEMAGACLVAGAVIVALGLLGAGERLLRWIPLPIVMGMFAGNLLGYVSGTFAQLEAQPWSVGAAILGYVGARAVGRRWCPPMAGAVVLALLAAALTGQVEPGAFRWSAPEVAPVRPAFDPWSLIALSPPLVVMAVGIGNVQGLGVLVSQGYRPPIKLLTVVTGAMSMVNAAFGGHTSTIQNNGAALLAGEEAGPREQRYVANLVAASLALLLALCASTAGTLLGVLPAGLVPALTGLALLGVVMDALRKTTATELPMGAFFALAIATSRLTLFGIGASFWALVGGLAVSLALERPALLRAWKAA